MLLAEQLAASRWSLLISERRTTLMSRPARLPGVRMAWPVWQGWGCQPGSITSPTAPITTTRPSALGTHGDRGPGSADHSGEVTQIPDPQ